MPLGALDMFHIGIGPSSSHTIGPMRAALQFTQLLEQKNLLSPLAKIQLHFFGSLALTGEGHGTIPAALNGLCGQDAKTIDPDSFLTRVDAIQQSNTINIANKRLISFNYATDIILHKQEFLPEHANGMRFIAYAIDQSIICSEEYFSIGGGFILDKQQMRDTHTNKQSDNEAVKIPYPFSTADMLLKLCNTHKISIAELVTRNEAWHKSSTQV